MRGLFLRYGLKHHLAHKFRLLMVLLSLSLGVAIFVSSYESVSSATEAIRSSSDAMSSKADWEISRGHFLGVEESLVAKIRSQPGAIAMPIIESTVSTAGLRPQNFLILGLDLDPDAGTKLLGKVSNVDLTPFVGLKLAGSGIVVSSSFSKSHSLKEGSEVHFQTANGDRSFTVVGISQSPELKAIASGNVGFVNIVEAEEKLGHPGTVDRIEVAGVSKGTLAKICPGCEIEPPGKLGSAGQDALGRIQSLLGVSVLALLVGLLLIYNSVQVSVLERLQDIAVLRAIGATRIQIFTLLLSEWLAIGLLGSTLGIFIGSGLAILLVQYTKRTVNTMVPLIANAHVSVTPKLVIVALAIGTGTAVIAAFLPVWSAANVRPLEILRPYSFRRTRRYLPAAGIGILIFIAANYGITHLHASISVGLIMVGLEFFSIALLFPQIVIVLGGWMRARLAPKGNPGPFLAFDSLLKAPHRTAFTMMTFGCSLMMTVATESLVDGFRESTGMWMSTAFPFDISVMGNDLGSSVYGNQGLPQSLTEKLRQVEGVSNAYSVRKLFTPFRHQDVMAVGIDLSEYIHARQIKRMEVWPPETKDPGVLAEYQSGKGVFVSNNFAQLFDVHENDQLRLSTPTGIVAFKVLGEVEDYSWPHGVFIINLKTLESKWQDDATSYIDLTVAHGFSLEDVKQRVQAVATQTQRAFAYDKRQIREVTDSVLEQAVGMANLQAAIAVLIGVIGVVNAIWIGVMNRKREIALWRAIGVTRGQVARIVLYEGMFISAVSALVGVGGGLYGGWMPLRSFSFDITGYLYPLVVPWPQIGMVTALSFGLGLLAGALPARQAARLPILESIGYE